MAKKEIEQSNQNKEYNILIENVGITLKKNSRQNIANTINTEIVLIYWQIGKYIIDYEQKGNDRAEYRKQVIEILANNLTRKIGTSYNKRNLQYFRKFYLLFRDFEIVNTCVRNLNWSHFRRLLSVSNETARLRKN